MKYIKPLFRFCALIAAVVGLVLNFMACPIKSEYFAFFTMQSNFLCLALLIWDQKKEPEAWFRGLATVCIALTAIVYHFLLRPESFTLAELWTVPNSASLFAHYIIPICVITDYLAFSPKGRIKAHYPPMWLIFPVFYIGFLKVYNSLGGLFIVDGELTKYPYFFLDADVLGIGGVTLWCLGIAAAILTASYLFMLLDRILSH